MSGMGGRIASAELWLNPRTGARSDGPPLPPGRNAVAAPAPEGSDWALEVQSEKATP